MPQLNIPLRRLFPAMLATLLLIAPVALAQDDAPPPVSEVAGETEAEVQPWEVSIDNLRLQILPLRQEALKAECERWITMLQAKTTELTEAKRARNATTDTAELAVLRERITMLEQQKAAITQRCDVVVSAYKAKGGDGEEYDKYLATVGGLELDVSDSGTALMQFRAWLVSKDGGQQWLWAIIKFVAILIVFWILSRIIGAIVTRAVSHVKGASALLRTFLSGLTRKVVLLIGAVVAVSALGVDIGPLVAAIGAAGLVIGFALQGTLSNFASGIMILFYKPYDIGHVIEAGGVTGNVEHMSLVSTTLVTADNQTIILPNNSVWGGVIRNITGRGTRRVDMSFTISAGNDVERAKAVLEEIVRSHELVLKDPPPAIVLSSYADASLKFLVLPWAKSSDYGKVASDIHAAVKRRFEQEGITGPVQRLDVNVRQAET